MSHQYGANPALDHRDELTSINAGVLQTEGGGNQTYLESDLTSDFVIIRAKRYRPDKEKRGLAAEARRMNNEPGPDMAILESGYIVS